jgi:hypothetical protein
VLTATGGAIADFRYIYIYNDTATNDELVGVHDYGSTVTVSEDATFTIDFDASNGLLTLA